jgi:hypothetical protein
MSPETKFNWGLGWTLSVLANTLKSHSRWMQNVSRGPVLLILVGLFKIKYNFMLKWENGEQRDRFCFCGTFTATTRYEKERAYISLSILGISSNTQGKWTQKGTSVF